jgi:hypothetical protein
MSRQIVQGTTNPVATNRQRKHQSITREFLIDLVTDSAHD